MLTVCLLFLGTSLGRADGPSIDTIKKMKSSVAPIECLAVSVHVPRVVNGNAGTAFFVNTDGNFVTANHVIDEVKSLNTKCSPAILAPPATRKNDTGRAAARPIYWFEPSSCSQDPADDVAVCRTIDNPFSAEPSLGVAMVTFETSQQQEGLEVAFTGFPNGYAWPVTVRASIATTTPLNSLPTITLDRLIWHGMSGAPLYSPSGNVIGVMIGGETGDNADLSVARPASVVVEYLRRLGVNYRIATMK